MRTSPPHSLHALLQAFPPLTNDTIKAAVELWCDNREEAAAIYGDIGGWDVSQVTDMRRLFSGQARTSTMTFLGGKWPGSQG